MQITIKFPDGEKSTWTDKQLVSFMSTVQGLVTAHMDACKAACRERVGVDGGKLTDGKAASVTVAKQASAKDVVDFAAMGKALLAQLDEDTQNEVKERFTVRKNPPLQAVNIK